MSTSLKSATSDKSSRKKKLFIQFISKGSESATATNSPNPSSSNPLSGQGHANDSSNPPAARKRTRPQLPPSPPYTIEPISDEIREGRMCFFHASYAPYRRIADVARKFYPRRTEIKLDLDLATDTDMLLVQATGMVQFIFGKHCRIRRTVIDQWHKDHIKAQG
ncbi:hypothetical protein BXZ70DRAFT_1076586 [Cristinia sonorae]|uniref:Uncharacterized protein n=1 Tax=Cristinia sonorae TaxID=1940300 RepID=A0A8K0XRN1_9AGAR|nr:hypothetical protein BXZ70DRAFT_1076586 [Cristinia sonorae]